MGYWDRTHRDHRFAQRRMPDALDGDLSARRRARFARHVAGCPQCGSMLRGLIRVRTALRSIGQATPEATSVAPGVIERLRLERLANAVSGRR